MYTHRVSDARQRVTVVANFAEVWLAKDGHAGPAGVNLLTKVQMPNLASLYGATLAGDDCGDPARDERRRPLGAQQMHYLCAPHRSNPQTDGVRVHEDVPESLMCSTRFRLFITAACGLSL
jgi:hypothetical protein